MGLVCTAQTVMDLATLQQAHVCFRVSTALLAHSPLRPQAEPLSAVTLWRTASPVLLASFQSPGNLLAGLQEPVRIVQQGGSQSLVLRSAQAARRVGRPHQAMSARAALQANTRFLARHRAQIAQLE